MTHLTHRALLGMALGGLVILSSLPAGFVGAERERSDVDTDRRERRSEVRSALRNERPISQLKDGREIRTFLNSIGDEEFAADEILVKEKGESRFRRVRVPAGAVRENIVSYMTDGRVEYAEPNYRAHAFSTPNDPYYSLQWNLDNAVTRGIHAADAWDVGVGTGVIVAVVDTGIAYETYWPSTAERYDRAPDLAGTCFVPGYDFVNNDTHPNDDESHGTHVAGTIAQTTNNALGVAGVARGACLMPVKVLDRNGSGTYADIAEGIIFAADNGAQVINLSLGGPFPSSALEDALAYAYAKGVTIVAAAGNDNASSVSYPAAYDAQVIATGATRYDETRAYYSNYGSSLDLVAPGGDITVDQNGDGYGDGILQNTFNPNTKNTRSFGYWFFQGTSMASPHVAGVAALVIAHGTAVTPATVRQAIEESADDLGAPGRDNTYGYGLVNAAAAMAWTGAPPPPLPPNVPPTANAGADQSVTTNSPVSFNGLGSSDSDGVIVSYSWDFDAANGIQADALGASTTHAYSVSGIYTATLTVTDDDGASSSDTAVITVTDSPPPPAEIELFSDSFEVSEWNGLWSEDSQNDWFRSSQRAIAGVRSAEVDGLANNAALTSISVALQGKTNATISFSWFIENSLDTGEYLAFDVSRDGGTTWIERARIRGNVDPENSWRAVSVSETNLPSLRLRFRGTMSSSSEDANVDMVRVVGY